MVGGVEVGSELLRLCAPSFLQPPQRPKAVPGLPVRDTPFGGEPITVSRGGTIQEPIAEAGDDGPACPRGLEDAFRESAFRFGELLGSTTRAEALARGPRGAPHGGLTMGFALAAARAMAEALVLDTGRVGEESPALRGRPRMAIEVYARMAMARFIAATRLMAFAMFKELVA